jgi:hypothetical protein
MRFLGIHRRTRVPTPYRIPSTKFAIPIPGWMNRRVRQYVEAAEVIEVLYRVQVVLRVY